MIRIRLAICVLATAVSAQAALRLVSVSNEPYPPAVGADGRTTTVYTAEMMLDGKPETFACLLDDSRGGARSDTKPSQGDAPVTGMLTLDLGGEFTVDGIELLPRTGGGAYLPSQIELFGVKYAVPSVSAGAGHVIRFTPQKRRTLELNVLASHESGPIHFNYQIAELRVAVKSGLGVVFRH